MVKLVDSKDEVENSVTEKPIQAKARLPHSPIKWGSSTKAAQKATKPRSIKEDIITVTVAVSSSDGRLKMLEIPCFMTAAWSSSFLPMLHDSLGRLKKPFAHFLKGLDIYSWKTPRCNWYGLARHRLWHPMVRPSLFKGKCLTSEC